MRRDGRPSRHKLGKTKVTIIGVAHLKLCNGRLEQLLRDMLKTGISLRSEPGVYLAM